MDAVRLKAGWTLYEMAISLAVTGAIFVLASNAALGHLRFVRGTGEIVALRTQLGHATAAAASVLRTVEAPDDILVAQDSVAEVYANYGFAFACRGDTARLVVPAPSGDSAAALSGFSDTPQAADRVRILVQDDTSASWVGATLTAAPATGGACAAYGGVQTTWSLSLAEPFVVRAGAALRFARRTRLSAYKASDGRWYLGMREWNGSAGSYNTVQPVAGPLRPVVADPSTTGFRFSWIDTAAVAMTLPVEPGRVAFVVLTARGETVRPARVAGLWSRAAPRYADSLSDFVVLRNRP